ncbi:MerR family transcriptional regulator [Methylobacterium sp. GC_Met_2]|uniref:MerR family transcriptional regulator n=1 Tax=Methylobacterium sp. GC_Met_2 TaxID=2937376 RepID=UPI00226B47DC|nr:MerR family transcriptional regulator [Methylobacterium sp. GC_Met_2]
MILRGIASVSEELDLQQYVLRYWETQFSHLRPIRRGRTRYYRQDDVELVAGIRHMLHRQGFTIAGVKQVFKNKGPAFVRSIGRSEAAGDAYLDTCIGGIEEAELSPEQRSALAAALSDPAMCRALAEVAVAQVAHRGDP